VGDSGSNTTLSSEAANEPMSDAERLAVLQMRHQSLDHKIHELQQNPYQNQLLIRRLKKEKLLLKDTIERLKNEMIPDLNA
jgi:hypothetical protein